MKIDWDDRWAAISAACSKVNASGRWREGMHGPPRFDIKPPASEADVVAVEARLGKRLPESFRRVVRTYSSAVDIQWRLSDERRPTGPLKGIFAGEIRWDLSALVHLDEQRRGYAEKAFADIKNPYDAVWHNKLPFLQTGCYDFVAIDLGTQEADSVTYLSTGDGDGHGYRLGIDFEDYLDRLSRLGGIGAEDWQWVPFTDGRDSLLQPDGEIGKIWRHWFGLP